MTNEQKANELGFKFFPDEENIWARANVEATKCAFACLGMAQWKDEQFSKFLLWLDDYFVIRKFDDGEPMTYAELIDNFKSNSYERYTTKTD